MIANEHLLTSEEVNSLSTGSGGGGSVSSEGVREGGVSIGSGETVEHREESPASSRSEQDHFEQPVVSGGVEPSVQELTTFYMYIP